MTDAAQSCPADIAGLFGAALAEAIATGKRQMLTLPPRCARYGAELPGVVVPVLPEFGNLPLRRIITVLWSVAQANARLAGHSSSPSAALPPQAGAVSTRRAPGGDARDAGLPSAGPTGQQPPAGSPLAAAGGVLSGPPAPANALPANVLPFAGGRR